MFTLALSSSLLFFATSKNDTPENQSFVSLGSMYCVHVKNHWFPEIFRSLQWQGEGKRKEHLIKIIWAMRERSSWWPSISLSPSLWICYTVIVYGLYNSTGNFFKDKIVLFYQHAAFFLNAPAIRLRWINRPFKTHF